MWISLFEAPGFPKNPHSMIRIECGKVENFSGAALFIETNFAIRVLVVEISIPGKRGRRGITNKERQSTHLLTCGNLDRHELVDLSSQQSA